MVCDAKKCCFFIDLKIGCLIIGYMTAIMDFMLLLAICCGVMMTHEPATDAIGDTVSKMFLLAFIIMLFFVTIHFVFVIYLIIGIHSKDRRYILAYLTCNRIYIALSILWFTIILTGGYTEVYHYILDLTYVGSSIYFYVVIRSYYWKLNDESIEPKVLYTAC